MGTNSGYSGGWIPPDQRSTFDNLYYIVMLNRPWVKTTVASRLDPSVTLTEWRSPLLEIDAMMLNIDAILGFKDIGNCNVFGEDPLGFLQLDVSEGGASFTPAPEDIVNCVVRDDDEYGIAVQDFAADNDVFLADYVSAFTKMIDDTVPCKDLELPACNPYSQSITGADGCVAHINQDCACQAATSWGKLIVCVIKETFASCTFDSVSLWTVMRGIGQVLKHEDAFWNLNHNINRRQRKMMAALNNEANRGDDHRQLSSDAAACATVVVDACVDSGGCTNKTEEWFECLEGTIFLGKATECSGVVDEDIWEGIASSVCDFYNDDNILA